MFKITEKIIEPYRIEVGYNFKIKIKAIRYATYSEVKGRFHYYDLQNYKYKTLKGE